MNKEEYCLMYAVVLKLEELGELGELDELGDLEKFKHTLSFGILA